MRFKVGAFDGRSRRLHSIIDEETNLSVGYITL